MVPTEDDRYAYVLRFYDHLMTEQEHLAYRHLVATVRATRGRTDLASQIEAKCSDPHLASLFSDDPDVLRLAIDDLQAFQTRTAQRILAEHSDQVAFNNCP